MAAIKRLVPVACFVKKWNNVMVTMQIKGAERLLNALNSLPARIDGGVKVTGPAASYWGVWEWGSVRITKPGPKTTWGTNPAGERVVLTLTAPTGYIRTNRQRYVNALRSELAAAGLASNPISQWPRRLRQAFNNASAICAEIIRQSAPEDTGQLKAGIVAVDIGDQILQQGANYSLGEEWL